MSPITLDLPPSLLLANLSPPASIVETLQRDEGLRLKLYRDTTGNWLIGYGRNLKGRGISSDEAMMLLRNDILACQGDLDKHLAWWRGLSDLRQMAMLSLCYNIGIYGLKEFKVALQAMRTGRYQEAARHLMASRWAKQVGQRARRITYLIEHDRPIEAVAEPEAAPHSSGAGASSRRARRGPERASSRGRGPRPSR